jgi:hypothetical protein
MLWPANCGSGALRKPGAGDCCNSTNSMLVPPPRVREKEVADRAVNDSSLQQADIAATGRGFIVFPTGTNSIS